MKSLLLPLSLLLVLVASLTSCVPLDDPAFMGSGLGGGGYGGGGDTSRTYSDSGSRYYSDDDRYSGSQSYRRPSGYYSSGAGYSSGYSSGYGAGYCTVCRHNPCCCSQHNRGSYSRPSNSRSSSSHHDHDDDDDHKHSSSGSSSSSSKYRYTGPVDRGDDRPVGNHSREWYKDRGYSLKHLKKAD